MRQGVYTMLSISGIPHDDAENATALSAWLSVFDWPGYELKILYNDDHGWGEDWYRWRRDPGALTPDAATNSAENSRQLALW